MKGWRLWRHAERVRARAGSAPVEEAVPPPVGPRVVQVDAESLRELSAVFAAPRWLRDLGVASWLLFGVAALLVGLVALLAVTAVIVVPVVVGLVLATVASPVVGWLQARGLPRTAGALLVLLGFVLLGVLIVVLVVGGIVAQADSIEANAQAAAGKAEGWLQDAGVDQSGASAANENVSGGVGEAVSTLAGGFAEIVSGVTSLVFFVVFSVFSLLFLLKDGPVFRGWVEAHMGVPGRVAETITSDVISSLRRYFLGVTIVAVFNAIVVGVGAWALGVPLAGTIAVVTLVTAYVPFIGAFVSGAFAVILALGAEGTETALIMLVIVLLANGLLQNIVQPIAFGATLGLNPLVVLIATIAGGSLFGMLGMILAAPLTSAVVHITTHLNEARATPPGTPETAEPEPATG